MINDPLQKQIVPFTLEKCVIRIIWHITQNLNQVAFRLSAQLLSIATHLSRLCILKLVHQTCWLSSYSYEVTQLRWFKRNICGHVFAAESARRLSMWVSSKEEREYSILYLSYPLLMWVTPVCGLLGLSESYFLFHIFEVISLRSYLLFCLYSIASLNLAERMQVAFEGVEEGVFGRQWRTMSIRVF